jgi:hypothetical protein
VHVVFDPVGGPLLAEALKTVAWGAQYLVIGFVAGIPKVPANLLLVKNTTVGRGRGAIAQGFSPGLQRLPLLMLWHPAGRCAQPLRTPLARNGPANWEHTPNLGPPSL